MKKTMLIGLILIVVGVLVIRYEGISNMTQDEVVHLGPLEKGLENQETIPVPRIVGITFLIGGIATVAYTFKKS